MQKVVIVNALPDVDSPKYIVIVSYFEIALKNWFLLQCAVNINATHFPFTYSSAPVSGALFTFS